MTPVVAPSKPAGAATAEPANASANAGSALREDAAIALVPVGLLLLGWFSLWNKLRGDWSTNEQYEYGWFVPPLAFVLLALRWPDRPPAGPALSRTKLFVLFAAALLLLLPLRLLEEPNPDWRLLLWAHGGVLTILSLALVAWSGGWGWVRHFTFPVTFLLLAIPWPSGFEQTIVQSLMRAVAAVSAESVALLGVPAQAQGNLIRIRDQLVGVSEACSGIRSLQATLMAGLLLGELSRLSWPRRATLLGSGLALALLANVFRSSLLVWVAAQHGAAALENVHDFAGFSVLLIVFAGLLGINRWLAPRQPELAQPRSERKIVIPVDRPGRLPAHLLVAAAIWLVAVEAGTAAWYAQPARSASDAPGWTVVPPAAPGYKELPIDHQTTQLLRYDEAISGRWRRPGPPQIDCTLFFFRWKPGHASSTQAEMHQPHVCLTATGMTEIADSGVQPVALAGGFQLPVRRYEFTLHGHAFYVFFVAWRDGVGAEDLGETPGSRWDRLRLVAEHRANLGRQTLELIAYGPTNPQEADEWFEREIGPLIRMTGDDVHAKSDAK